jgi:hypothetical protein
MTHAERHILRGNPWPYGAQGGAGDRMIDWATERGLMLSGSRKCLHWLDKGRCPHDGWRDYDEGFCRGGRHSHHWMDHVTAWRGAGGRRLMLCQPYGRENGLSDAEIADLENVAKTWKFHIDIFATGWYGYGTTAIELTRARETGDACVMDFREFNRGELPAWRGM